MTRSLDSLENAGTQGPRASSISPFEDGRAATHLKTRTRTVDWFLRFRAHIYTLLWARPFPTDCAKVKDAPASGKATDPKAYTFPWLPWNSSLTITRAIIRGSVADRCGLPNKNPLSAKACHQRSAAHQGFRWRDHPEIPIVHGREGPTPLLHQKLPRPWPETFISTAV